MYPDFLQQPCSPARLQAGQVEALTCYSFRYIKPLSRYARHFTKDLFIGEDLAAKALEKLWEHRAEMHSERAIHDFLRKAIYQELCNWVHTHIIGIKEGKSER